MRQHLVSAPGIAVRRGQSAVLIPNELLVRVARTDYADAGLRSCSEHAFGRQTNWENLEPQEFMQRLATLVLRPRLHLIRFHGVLAPNTKLRSEIISSPVEQATEPACDHAQAQGAPARMSWARLLKRVFDIDIDHCPNCGGSLKIIACPEPSSKGRHRRSAGDCQNPYSSGPADPRPGAASRFIPDNLRAENRLPTQADGAARSEFERAA